MIEDVPKLLAVASELGLNVVGVSFHVGSGCGDVDAYARALEKVSWVFNIGNTFGFQMNMVDIGGGFLGNEGTSIAEVRNSRFVLRKSKKITVLTVSLIIWHRFHVL